ncbi:cystathionine gamma-synthase family protein [Ramlibacter sp.]|uniref:cystathionine gamma-synthase family protein n=1 Tax=Ramlibacter sp. TaxID=1917967 RepID=UPI001819D269|nr:cystathionine gamma-synthase family protein [Ramlibacter sp.]MBA2675856.1 cystathionine gamma-synthase family protein [Ramlibacter sp.]
MSRDKPGLATRIVHADRHFGVEHNAIRKPIHNSVQYSFDKVEDLIGVFQGTVKNAFNYSRTGTPTTAALEAKLTQLEEGVGSVCYASGMGAISATLLTMLKAGDQLISGRYVFAGTNSLFGTMRDLGIEVAMVDTCNAANVEAALKPNTRMVFVETIANPGTEVPDLGAIGELCARHGILFVIDNTITSPALFLPRRVKAGLSINSLSKTISGHGVALGGVVTDTGVFDWQTHPNISHDYRKGDPRLWGLQQLRKKGLRDMGASLSSDSASQIGIGAETLALRIKQSSSNAMALAKFLQGHPAVKRVNYPGLESHPQYALAREHFSAASWLLSFEFKDLPEMLPAMNRLQIASRATGMGDTRTLVIPVAPSIYYEAGPEARALMNVTDGLVRVSVGIEEVDDLLDDFDQALRG